MQKNSHILLWLVVLGIAFSGAYYYYVGHSQLNGSGQPAQNSSTDNSSPGDGQNSSTGNSPSTASKGKIAPEITLNDLNGQTIKLSNYRGKIVILNFWASWCPPCKSEMTELNRAAWEFAQGTDAVLLTVNLTDGSRETAEKARKYITDNKYSMSVLLDTQSRAAKAYRVTSIPTTYIIDKNGIVIDYIVGPTTMDALSQYVNQLK